MPVVASKIMENTNKQDKVYNKKYNLKYNNAGRKGIDI